MDGVSPLLALAPLTAGRAAVLVLAGFAAGVFNGVAGGGTLISFPVLLAMGYPALTANVTSTVGIWPGYLGGIAGFHREIIDQRARVRELAPVAIVGATGGAVLLLTTPSAAFARIAPWLILFAAALFAVQPLLVRAVADRQHRTRRALLVGGTLLASVYGGYFGAGMGIVLLAVLGLTLPDTLVRTSGMRSMLSVLVNGVAAVVFLAHGSLVWKAVAMLAIGSVVGGWAGARVVRIVPAHVLRVVVVLIGVGTFVRLVGW